MFYLYLRLYFVYNSCNSLLKIYLWSKACVLFDVCQIYAGAWKFVTGIGNLPYAQGKSGIYFLVNYFDIVA